MRFAELLARPGVTEVCEMRSRFGFMAFHGGALEEMTDVIAAAAAEAAGASLYAVVQPPGSRTHVRSIDVRPEHSPSLQAFLDHVEVVVTVHGYGRPDMVTSLLLGGRNRALADHVGAHLRAALPDYDVVVDLDRIPPELRGLHARNPVNLPAQGGVQLELPPRVRGRGRRWAGWPPDQLVPPTEALIEALGAAARAWSLTAPAVR